MSNYSNLINGFVLPAVDMISGSRVMSQLKRWRSFQASSKDEIFQIQTDSVKDILDHCLKNISFFKNLDLGIDQIESNEDLSYFPIMDKEVVSRNEKNLIFGNPNSLAKILTSGSSGVQGFSYLDKSALSINRAIQIHWWEEAGYSLGMRTIQFGVDKRRSLIKSIKDLLLRIYYVPAFGNDDKHILDQIREIQKRKIQFLSGYASSLFLLAQTAKNHGMKMPRLMGAVSWGEKLFPHFETCISEVFNCNVIDTYGSSEGLNIALRCENGKYHIMEPHVHVEVVDGKGRPCPDGKLGRILVTRLDNYSFPLIRYALGDIGILAPKDSYCGCGSPYRFFEEVIGRETDLILGRNGETITVQQVVYFMKHIPGLLEYQVCQESTSDLRLDYVRPDLLSEDELKVIKTEFNSQVITPFRIKFNKLDDIPPTRSGKRQLIRSKISPFLDT